MGYSIPVCYFPVDKAELPEKLENWLSVEKVLLARWEKPEESSFRCTASRNWWHQDALDQISKGLSIKGLEFVLSEVACLSGSELETASAGLEIILHEIADGLPFLGDHEVDHGSVWWMRQHEDEGSFAKAFEKAQPTFDASASKDTGFEATVAFCSFIKSLKAAASEALSQHKYLLYVQPQP